MFLSTTARYAEGVEVIKIVGEGFVDIVERGEEHSALRYMSSTGAVTKSGIMVGLGESDEEVIATLRDLRDAGVRIVTLGQYLRPSLEHYPVAAYITPEKFDWYRQKALEMGFDYCASAPLVRSSYLAEEALKSVQPK